MFTNKVHHLPWENLEKSLSKIQILKNYKIFFYVLHNETLWILTYFEDVPCWYLMLCRH